jgi:hypothetical protein
MQIATSNPQEITALPVNAQPVMPAAMTLVEIQKAAEWMAASRLFGVKTWQEAASLMLLSQAEGIPAVLAVRDYHIIDGKPSLKAEVMLARFLAAGGRVEWHERTDKAAEATFSHPLGGTIRVRWDIAMATLAGLADKPVWKKYSRQLLHARCASEGCRAVYPAATGHVYTPEEVRDMREEEPSGRTCRHVMEGSIDLGPQPDPASGADRLQALYACASDGEVRAWWNSNKEWTLGLEDADQISVREKVSTLRREIRAGTEPKADKDGPADFLADYARTEGDRKIQTAEGSV